MPNVNIDYHAKYGFNSKEDRKAVARQTGKEARTYRGKSEIARENRKALGVGTAIGTAAGAGVGAAVTGGRVKGAGIGAGIGAAQGALMGAASNGERAAGRAAIDGVASGKIRPVKPGEKLSPWDGTIKQKKQKVQKSSGISAFGVYHG